jgi:hypothetical protein
VKSEKWKVESWKGRAKGRSKKSKRKINCSLSFLTVLTNFTKVAYAFLCLAPAFSEKG